MLKKYFTLLVQTLRLIVGIHDYDKYIAHVKQHHPQKKPMTKKQFYQYCQQNRYPNKNKAGSNCPC